MQPKQPISVIDDVPGGTTETYRHTFDDDAEIEGGRVRFYPSQELDLRVEIEHIPENGDGTPVSLIEHLGKEFLAGDDDVIPLDVRREVAKGDELVIRVENNETEWTYDAQIQLNIDREGGIIARLRNALEVF